MAAHRDPVTGPAGEHGSSPKPGATLWFTGLPASGKSAAARRVRDLLESREIAVELLDGGEVRQSLSRGLTFSHEDREEHVRRMGYVAKLLSRNGIIAICVAVSPYRSTRDEVRANVTNFIEIFVDCPLAVAESRDTEGAYAKARRGEIEEFTGVNAPYEPPERPEVHIHSDRETPDVAANKVITTLEVLGIIPLAGIGGGPSSNEEEIRERLAGLGYV